MKRALVIGMLVALALPASALAHASLVREAPSFGQRLPVSPRRVVLRFDETVDALPKAIEVLTPEGANLAGAAHAIPGEREIVASLPRLAKGA